METFKESGLLSYHGGCTPTLPTLDRIMMKGPSRVTADIHRLCRKFGSATDPFFVKVIPRADSGDGDCFIDVQRQISEHGGEIQHGWLIWEWPGIAVEGEFHAVWRRPDGVLIDVARKPDGEESVLFAPDSERIFSGRRIPNIRHAVGADPRIKQWISLVESIERMTTRAFKDVPFGTVVAVEGKALDLRIAADSLAMDLEHSRSARRAR